MSIVADNMANKKDNGESIGVEWKTIIITTLESYKSEKCVSSEIKQLEQENSNAQIFLEFHSI